jgi:hypothetical protein
MRKESGRMPFSKNFKLNTMDIAVAVILAVINAAYVIAGAIGYVEKVFMATGVLGYLAFYIIEGLMWPPMFIAGFLRKKIGVMMLVGFLFGAIRWALGDPDGLLLTLMYTFGTAGAGLWLNYRNWKPSLPNWWVAGVIEFWIVDGLIWFPYYGFPGGLEIFLPSMLVGTVFQGLWGGILGLWIGKALTKTGVIEVVEAPTPPKS